MNWSIIRDGGLESSFVLTGSGAPVSACSVSPGGHFRLLQPLQLIVIQSAGSAEQILANPAVPDEEVTVPICYPASLPQVPYLCCVY